VKNHLAFGLAITLFPLPASGQVSGIIGKHDQDCAILMGYVKAPRGPAALPDALIASCAKASKLACGYAREIMAEKKLDPERLKCVGTREMPDDPE